MSGFGAAIDRVRELVETDVLPTAVFGVTTGAGVAELVAFGGAGARVARVEDHYALFSITKPIVGLTALRAIERGLLTPRTPLTTAVPDFGDGRDDVVRLEHLVSHTSGIPEPPLDTPDGLEASLLAPGRDFAAGTVSRYSTIAFAGVAALVEHATGRSLDREIAALAEAAGADGLTFDLACDPHGVIGAAEHGLDVATFARLRHPGAGLYGRARDLLALGTALLRRDEALIRPITHAAMLRPLFASAPRLEPYPPERGQDWGFAWNLPLRAPGVLDLGWYGHSGWAGTEFWVSPAQGVAFTLLTNRARPAVDLDALQNAVTGGA